MSTTHVAIILDRSSSMGGTKKETISGFNEQIDQIRENAKDQNITVSLVTFNANVFEHLWLEDASKLSNAKDEDYVPNGSTAMRDALGYTIDKFAKTTDIEDENTDYLVIVISDGMTNCDSYYNPAQLKEMVDGLNATGRWTFTYMGCDRNVVEHVARETGIPVSNAAVWSNDTAGNARKGFAASKQRMNHYFASKKSGVKLISNVYSDSEQVADFCADEPKLDDQSTGEPTPQPEPTPVDPEQLIKKLKAGWVVGQPHVELVYTPVESSCEGYFSNGSKITMNNVHQQEPTFGGTMATNMMHPMFPHAGPQKKK